MKQWLDDRANPSEPGSPGSSSALLPATEPMAIPGSLAAAMRKSRLTRVGSSHGMLSASGLNSSHSLPLDYADVELPSLTMPASIRRCQQPSTLEPQSRVHTLSAIADQTFRGIEDNIAHRTAKPRDREPVNLPIVQETDPQDSWRLTSLQVVRHSETDTAVCSSPQCCSVPLYQRVGLTVGSHASDCTIEADGWHGSREPQAGMRHNRSRLSLADAAISPDLVPASVGSERRVGADTETCEGSESCTMPQMPVETIGSWTHNGGCELQIGSAPNPSLADDRPGAPTFDSF